jgi:hypothetical protein
MRVSAGVQGGVVGLAAFLAAWALSLLALRWAGGRGFAPGVLAAVALLCAAGGSLAGALRRIPLARCARALDRTDASRNSDRTRIALAFLDVAAGDPFVDAAVADAVRVLAPRAAVTAAPVRRPRGLPLAAALALITVGLSLWPLPKAPASSARGARSAAAKPASTPLAAALLAPDRDVAAAAARAAVALDDAELARLTKEFEKILEALAAGALEQGAALEKLAQLERAAEAAAREGRASEQAMRAVGNALEREKLAEAVSKALRELDGAAAKKALEELGAKAAEMPEKQRDQLAKALDRAAAASSKASGGEEGGADGEQQRRLPQPSTSAAGGERSSGPRERQLKRLERDLSDGADRCREDPEACKRALEQAGSDMNDMARDAQRSQSRQSLGRAMEQLRERLRRQNPGDRAAREAEQSFERAAGGMQPMPGQQGDQGQGEGERVEGMTGTPGSSGGDQEGGGSGGEQAGAALGAASEGKGEAMGADGVGKEAGGDPLGPRAASGALRGQTREARVRSGAGPSRAEVIEAGAKKGFARTEYQRVFEDYSAAVEEALDTTAVPAPRRYLVRRYFELIRPRVAGGGKEASSRER